MSRGLGVMQRQMLSRLAQHEVGLAEVATELQRPYRSPERWSLTSLIYAAAYDKVTAWQRAEHDSWQATLRAWKAGDEDARKYVGFLVSVTARFRKLRKPIDLNQKEFVPGRPDDHDLQRLHPSRAIVGLERRGFVLRDRYHRFDNLALTVEGFAEARRLGGVPDSEIVDLDRVAANWREPDDFMLGFTGPLLRDDDAAAIRRAARAVEEAAEEAEGSGREAAE